jgi:hypothetical protein
LDEGVLVPNESNTKGRALMHVLVGDFGDSDLKAISNAFDDAPHNLSFAFQRADTLEIETEATDPDNHD